MKLLVIKFENKVDLSPLPWDTEVTVSDGTNLVRGKVVTPVGPMADPPTLGGTYLLTPVTPP